MENTSLKPLENFLGQIAQISDQYRKEAAATGENFNIFKILNVESSEVRLHSSFLAELLNPKGSHGQGSVFLKLFIENLGIELLNPDTAKVFVEKDVGPINSDYTQGGKLDIVITDNEDHPKLIIENKIYAKDQPNQLFRYYNFAPEAHLFYLTLDGSQPSKQSVYALADNQYRLISYKKEIINWLSSCREKSNLPVVSETIDQYRKLVKHLTNQTEQTKMNDEIMHLIKNSPELIDSMVLCSKGLESIVNEVNIAFENMLRKRFPREKIYQDETIVIVADWAEDNDGMFFGYQACLATNDNQNVSGSENAKRFPPILKKINSDFKSNKWWLGWLNPEPFAGGKRFKALPKKEIVEMSSKPKILEKVVETILEKEKEIRKEFLSQIALNNKPPS